MSKKLTNWKLFSNTDHARSVFKLDLNQLKLYNNLYSYEEKESAAMICTIANAAFLILYRSVF